MGDHDLIVRNFYASSASYILARPIAASMMSFHTGACIPYDKPDEAPEVIFTPVTSRGWRCEYSGTFVVGDKQRCPSCGAPRR